MNSLADETKGIFKGSEGGWHWFFPGYSFRSKLMTLLSKLIITPNLNTHRN